MWVEDRLDGLWRGEDFTHWYPRDGRPGLSPAQLATVCVLQFLLDLSDRQAVEAVRRRIDFKYALAMDLDDPGLHHSVLADFRERLTRGDRADRLLDLAPARLKDAGLVRERTTQRTDSTHVLAAVRDLTQLELITEAMRAALEELAAPPRTCWPAWSPRTGAAATAARSGPRPRPTGPGSAADRRAGLLPRRGGPAALAHGRQRRTATLVPRGRFPL
ncbi:transposase [Kitasatospora sp. GP82]|uniref:transposase n=1 Tax=Kitasatospora sp. GP82 TaxID=3035089 RepID=UPI002474FF98|nr:transposase [Kitasatospora sp. GP82]